MLNRRFRGARIVRTVILFPLMIAPVVAAIMVTWMFNDQFGIVNVILQALGFEPVVWFLYRSTSMAIVILTDIWLWTPWFTIILLAGLQSLPPEPREAAMIDGAGSWRIFWKVTLPLLRPVLLVCVVIRAIDAFRVFDIVWVITKGEPVRSTEVFSIYAYKQAFVYLNFDLGSAAAIIGAVIIDTYAGLLFPHMSVHICFFSWLMKGFFDGIDSDMEFAAQIDGCSRWGAFFRVALPQAIPGIAALAILTWLWTWSEFLFALILTGSRTPMLTVTMAQFVHELGIEWNLMSATAVMALVPAALVTLFAQDYVVKGLRV